MEAGQQRVRPARRAEAAGRRWWRQLETLAVALGREVDAGGAAEGGDGEGAGAGRGGTVLGSGTAR